MARVSAYATDGRIRLHFHLVGRATEGDKEARRFEWYFAANHVDRL